MSTVKPVYVAANTRADLPPGSTHLAMDALLMSDQVGDVTKEITHVIAASAIAAAPTAGVDTGDYMSSFHVDEGVPIFAGTPSFPRRTFELSNTSEAAAHIEFGGRRPRSTIVDEPHHIIFNAGEPFHTPKGVTGGFA